MTDRLLKKWGEYYLLLMMLVSRLFALIGGGLTIYYVNLTVTVSPTIALHLKFAGATIVVSAVATTMLLAHWETLDLRKVLALCAAENPSMPSWRSVPASRPFSFRGNTCGAKR